jgi:eukaryotic-like serine/threonine-protein kinase
LAVTDVTPRRIGPYEVQGLLGEGGIGQVYAARDTLLGRQVAIKALRPEMSRDRNLIDRFYVEAKSLANLNHPNITTLYALQLEGQDAFMVMELVRGNTLNDLLARVGRFSLRESLAVVAQAVAGLGYAHRMGVIHRDIKPSNLMVTDEGVLKIMDFGIARVSGSQQLTRTGDFQGTLAYASPEQIRGERVDERSDLYSLAIVLYKLLAGVAPFDGIGDYALMTAHLQTPPPPLRGRVPELDVPIEGALMQALAKRPEDRFASVAEFGRAVGAAALRNEAGDILQQLFDRAFRDGAEATRIITTPARPQGAEPATQPTPQRTPWLTTDPTPQPTPQATPQPSLSDLLPRGFSIPETAKAGEPPISRSVSAEPRRARWPYAVVGGMAAALVIAGWFFLLPPSGDRAPQPSLAQEQPQPDVAVAGTAGKAVALATEPSKPTAERPAPAQPEPPAPAEKPAPAVEERLPAAAEPPAPVSSAPVVTPTPSVSRTTVVAPAADKPAAVETAPPATIEAAPTAPATDAPRPPSEPAPTIPPPAKPEVPTSVPPASEMRVTSTEPQISAEKQASLGPPASAPAQEPEGKPDLQGKVTGAKALDEIEVNSQWIRIYGIRDRAQNVKALLRYLAPARNVVVCYRKASETYRCYADGQDIARLALKDRIAQLAPNAPAEYRSLLVQKR